MARASAKQPCFRCGVTSTSCDGLCQPGGSKHLIKTLKGKESLMMAGWPYRNFTFHGLVCKVCLHIPEKHPAYNPISRDVSPTIVARYLVLKWKCCTPSMLDGWVHPHIISFLFMPLYHFHCSYIIYMWFLFYMCNTYCVYIISDISLYHHYHIDPRWFNIPTPCSIFLNFRIWSHPFHLLCTCLFILVSNMSIYPLISNLQSSWISKNSGHETMDFFPRFFHLFSVFSQFSPEFHQGPGAFRLRSLRGPAPSAPKRDHGSGGNAAAAEGFGEGGPATSGAGDPGSSGRAHRTLDGSWI